MSKLQFLAAVFTIFVVVQSVYGGGGASIDEDEDGKGGKLSFSPPDLSDEEAHSPFMPDMLKCEGCKAVNYQFYTAFKNIYDLKKSLKGNLPESDIIDVVDKVCHGKKTFDGYGIKEIKKVKHLSGPGIPDLSTGPSILQGGGKWPSRLHDMCDEFIGEIGDIEIYDIFREKPKLQSHLEDFLCYNVRESIQGSCTKVDGVKRWKDEL